MGSNAEKTETVTYNEIGLLISSVSPFVLCALGRTGCVTGSNMKLNPQDLEKLADRTLEHYNQRAEDFWEGTRDHKCEPEHRGAIAIHLE